MITDLPTTFHLPLICDRYLYLQATPSDAIRILLATTPPLPTQPASPTPYRFAHHSSDRNTETLRNLSPSNLLLTLPIFLFQFCNLFSRTLMMFRLGSLSFASPTLTFNPPLQHPAALTSQQQYHYCLRQLWLNLYPVTLIQVM